MHVFRSGKRRKWQPTRNGQISGVGVGGQSPIFDKGAGQRSGLKRFLGRHDKEARWRRTRRAPTPARGNGSSWDRHLGAQPNQRHIPAPHLQGSSMNAPRFAKSGLPKKLVMGSAAHVCQQLRRFNQRGLSAPDLHQWRLLPKIDACPRRPPPGVVTEMSRPKASHESCWVDLSLPVRLTTFPRASNPLVQEIPLTLSFSIRANALSPPSSATACLNAGA